MRFLDLIQSFASRLGFTIEENSDGVYNFEIDGSAFTIYDLSNNDQVVFTGDLGLPPSGQQLDNLYQLLLEAQYLFKETQGATFSIHPETGHITICRPFALFSLDAENFFTYAEQFINTLKAWVKVVQNFRSTASSTQTSTDSNLENGFFGGEMLLV